MSPIATAATVFACVFGGALLGMALRTLLPAHHLGAESRDHVKLGMGLIVTMSALLLGMLVASAKSAYEDQKSELTQLTAKLVFLDRVLAHYGPDAQVAREGLRTATARAMEQIWPKDRTDARQLSPIAAGADVLYNQIQELSPKDESQRVLKAQASAIAIELGQTRWLMFEQRGSSVSTALLIIVVFWLTVIFISVRDLGVLRDLPDPRDGPAVRGDAPDLQGAAAGRPLTPGPIRALWRRAARRQNVQPTESTGPQSFLDCCVDGSRLSKLSNSERLM
jgi:hypothetical protein